MIGFRLCGLDNRGVPKTQVCPTILKEAVEASTIRAIEKRGDNRMSAAQGWIPVPALEFVIQAE
jgi:hypothetical protein